MNPKLQSYAWNIPEPYTEWGKAAIAAEVMLRAPKRLQSLLYPTWFNFAFAWRHHSGAKDREKLAKMLAEHPEWKAHKYPGHQ